ncbi:MAG: nitrate/nitrite transporter [Halobacteria archaeon]
MSNRELPSYRWAVLGTAFLAHSLGMAFIQIGLSDLAPVMAENSQMSKVAVQGIYSAIIFTTAFTQIPGGIISDKYGIRWVAGGGIILMSLATVSRGFTQMYEVQIFLSVLVGIGDGLLHPSLIKLPSLWFPKKEHGLAQGINTLGFYVGSAVSGSITAGIALTVLGDWQHIMIVYGILAGIIGVLWLVIVKEPPFVSNIYLDKKIDEDVDEDETVEEAVSGHEDLRSWINLLKKKETYIFAGIGILVFPTALGFIPEYPSWVDAMKINLDPVWIGTPMYAAALGSVLVPTASSKFGRKRTLYGTISIMALVPLLSLVGGFFSYLVLMLVIGFAIGGIIPVVYLLPAESKRVEKDEVASTIGVMRSTGQLGQSTFVMLSGVMLSGYGLGASTLILALPIFFAIPLIYWLRLE